MGAVRDAIPARRLHWRDNASWQEQIDQAISTPDPVLANLRITAAHHELSLALHAVLGSDSGANFHTWATWGSKKAGRTIRQEEASYLNALAPLIGGCLGLLAMAALPLQSGAAGLFACAGGALLGALGLHTLIRRRRDHASRMILGGNITVLDDIGRQTARFVSTFQGHPDPDPRRLADFLAFLRPGPSESGGQDLLRKAFTHYYHAMHASSRARTYEHMLLANLCAILHEHIRLQPYIAGAMPRPARRLITRHLLDFSLGERVLRVGEDVVPPAGVYCQQRAEDAELLAFLKTWDRAGGGVTGSRAMNWADIRDRMAFVCALFRTSHRDPGLFTAPYTDAQLLAMEAGRVPAGVL